MKIKDLPQEIIDLIYDFIGKIDISTILSNKKQIYEKEILKPRNFYSTIRGYNPLFNKWEQHCYNNMEKKILIIYTKPIETAMSKEEYIEIGTKLVKEGKLKYLM
jgi:hypothetical protein